MIRWLVAGLSCLAIAAGVWMVLSSASTSAGLVVALLGIGWLGLIIAPMFRVHRRHRPSS